LFKVTGSTKNPLLFQHASPDKSYELIAFYLSFKNKICSYSGRSNLSPTPSSHF